MNSNTTYSTIYLNIAVSLIVPSFNSLPLYADNGNITPVYNNEYIMSDSSFGSAIMETQPWSLKPITAEIQSKNLEDFQVISSFAKNMIDSQVEIREDIKEVFDECIQEILWARSKKK